MDGLITGQLFDRWRASRADTAEAFQVLNPATGQALNAYRQAGAVEVDSIVRHAAASAETWGRTTPAERSALLLKLADRFEARLELFTQVEISNTGKPAEHAAEEVAGNVDFIRFIAGAARVAHGPVGGEYLPSRISMLRREPIGVVGVITPWNYPLMEAVWKIVPALAAGNAVVVKPSELTPETTLLFVELAQELLPAGVLDIVLGDARTGAALVEHPLVGMVSLTGDTATGRKVAAAAATTLKRVHLELGGKAPVLVFADADVSAVAEELAPKAFANAGQNCTSPCRIIVERAVYDDFARAFNEAVGRLRPGAPDEDGDVGPLISQRQLDRVGHFVERARESGALIAVGGYPIERPGYFYAPTVIQDVEQQSEIVQKEVFGPVVTIQAGSSEDAMLEMANGVAYGLAASVWTSDLNRSVRLSRSLRFGTVWINDHDVLANEMPFGGFGQSGYGKELSAAVLDEYTQVKHVMSRFSA